MTIDFDVDVFLREFDRDISGLDCPRAVAGTAVQGLHPHVAPGRLGILAFDTAAELATVFATIEDSGRFPTGSQIPLGSLGSLDALSSPHVWRLDEDPARPDMLALVEGLRAMGLRHIVSAPLLADDRLLGLLTAGFEDTTTAAKWFTIVPRIAPSLARAMHDRMAIHPPPAPRTGEALQELRGRALRVGEEERRRIAEGIHDDVIHVVSAAGLRIELAARAIDDPEQQQRLERAATDIRDAVDKLSALVFDLRPVALERGGLAEALRQCVAIEWPGDPTSVTVIDRSRREPSNVAAVVLYRAAREAIANASRHALAKGITVVVDQRDGAHGVTVADDGRGFDPTAENDVDQLGLLLLRERVAAIGGTVDITSRPGLGTRVEVWVPDDGERR